jgi:hypothetical protein
MNDNARFNGFFQVIFDGFVKSLIPVLRLALTVAPIGLKHRTACHPEIIRRTTSTHAFRLPLARSSSGFARLELELFTLPSEFRLLRMHHFFAAVIPLFFSAIFITVVTVMNENEIPMQSGIMREIPAQS